MRRLFIVFTGMLLFAATMPCSGQEKDPYGIKDSDRRHWLYNKYRPGMVLPIEGLNMTEFASDCINYTSVFPLGRDTVVVILQYFDEPNDVFHASYFLSKDIDVFFRKLFGAYSFVYKYQEYQTFLNNYVASVWGPEYNDDLTVYRGGSNDKAISVIARHILHIPAENRRFLPRYTRNDEDDRNRAGLSQSVQQQGTSQKLQKAVKDSENALVMGLFYRMFTKDSRKSSSSRSSSGNSIGGQPYSDYYQKAGTGAGY